MIFIPSDGNTPEPITLDQFNRACESIGRISKLDDYTKLMPHLRALAANSTLLDDFYAREFTDYGAFKRKQKQTAQTLILSELTHCDVRLVFWPAASLNTCQQRFKTDTVLALAAI